MNKIILFFAHFFLLCNITYSQLIFKQGIINGGVTAAGFSAGTGSGGGTFDIYIEPGSTIKKAYAFSYRVGFPPSTTFILNGNTIVFDTNNVLMNVSYTSPYASPHKLYYTDITSLISNINLSNLIILPSHIGQPINWGYWSFFIYVIYENPILPTTSYTILINDKNLTGNEFYNANNLNPINKNFPVGFSLYTDRTGGVTSAVPTPNCYTYFNNNLLGIIGGSDNVNSSWNYAGVKGHFYYQNNQLFGLDDDTPDVLMSGTDGLADVSSYLSNNATSCNFQLTHIEYPNQLVNATNVNLAFFLTYTSPCAPFDVSVTNDTTICLGEQLQLLASSANPNATYEWSVPAGGSSGNPAPGLSCSNCPNPVFSGDSSMFYTVRIWNNDSCSVVRPVHITVKKPPVVPQFTTLKAVCGIASGSINVQQPQETGVLYLISENGDTLAKPLNKGQNTTQGGLFGGNYTVYFQDSLGCRNDDSSFVIPTSNNTVAGFTVSPQSGGAPLEVAINNTSVHAQNYNWYVNGILQNDPFTGFVADTSGSYQIMLVAWQNDASCADTAYATVNVYDSLIVHVPNVFTPNGDGVNDFFSITTNLEVNANLVILNRWGEVVYRFEGNLQTGENKLWNTPATDGVYFYKLTMDNLQLDNYSLKKEGFITVVR